MARMQDKVVLISGAGTGIGKATAQRLAGEGARIVASDLDQATAEATAQFVAGRALAHDVRSEADWQRVIDDIRANEGRLDALINNAGILALTAEQDPEQTTLEEWQAVQKVNLDGVFLGCKYAIPLLRDSGGGSIVNLSSIAALMGTPHVTAYGASKGGVRQFSKSVAVHCARQGYGIRCNSVHPGLIETDMGTQVLELRGPDIEVSKAERAAMIPMGELGQAADVANVILFLASDESRYVTGAELVVDGGTTVV
ncbi:MAG TPA: SDR family oxidoreductase [Alphaproteobacteria bacterium]|jgi:NAD(P)-dependent dehydrogenase (short-subunit alcohol dehydrogenase family)|nr:SDR family oxidoreductase [Alphaproteobacteria bacterium]HJM51910.1 SDR family oxidoreductase [Alphaproteobacteria bacterium]|tara:strand:- start:135 stop:902 length:768 start_codon:yes stop_codon:yes gene_type:complete